MSISKINIDKLTHSNHWPENLIHHRDRFRILAQDDGRLNEEPFRVVAYISVSPVL